MLRRSSRDLFPSILLVGAFACSSHAAAPTDAQPEAPKAPRPLAWHELPPDPGDSDAHPEGKTATVVAPPPSASPNVPSLVDGQGACTTDADCVVTGETSDCCSMLCPPGAVISKAMASANAAKRAKCDKAASCPPPSPCPASNIVLRPVCDHGQCKGQSTALAKGAVPGSAESIAALQTGLDKCYKDALAKDPKTEGQAQLVVKIGADASVLSVTPTRVDGLSDALVDCLVGVAQKGQFQRPVGGVGTLYIPIDLTRHPAQ